MNKALLTRTTPAFTSAFREMDEMQNRLRRFFGPATSPDLLATESVVGWMPPVEIVEQPDALLLTAELPGLTRENIEVSFEDDVLTIRGEKKEERKEEKAEEKDRVTYHLVERSYGAFSRSFVMPRTIDPSKITADFEAGVLKVRLPKLEAARAKGRKIEVNAK
jgi:HSP20 family protein